MSKQYLWYSIMKVTQPASLEVSEQMSLALFVHATNNIEMFEGEQEPESPTINLSEELLRNPSASFATYARDDYLSGVGIGEGDLLLVDKKLKPSHSDIVIFSHEGELRCRILDMKNSQLFTPDHEQSPIDLNEQVGLVIEGVVIQAVKRFR